MSPIKLDHRLERQTESSLQLKNPYQIPVSIYANQDIPIETVAIDELENLLDLQDTIEKISQSDRDFFGADAQARIEQIVLTPDFHKGAGIPIGTVLATYDCAIPQAIGNDINCGMRLMRTNLSEDSIRGVLPEIEKSLRHVFFEGGRQIPLLPKQREALFLEGLPGLLESAPLAKNQGIWKQVDLANERENLKKMHGQGSYLTQNIYALQDYIQGSGGLSYDALIGSLGGGNHFAEIQVIRKILDGQVAHAWGLKPGQIVVMIHSGSLEVGHVTGGFAREQLQAIYPPGLTKPRNGIYPLPVRGKHQAVFDTFISSMYNAANFAFGNRFFLAQMVKLALEKHLGESQFDVIWDAPHNLMWQSQGQFIHRKGATPARGWESLQNTPYAHWGEPVIVPGSMGSASYLLVGQGHGGALCSACHGAGRQLSRGDAIQADDALLDAFLREFRVVTALDPEKPEVKNRHDIIQKWRQELKKEAPYAYKAITPVIQTLQQADIARPVAELWPLISIKG